MDPGAAVKRFVRLCGAASVLGGMSIILARGIELALFPGQPLSNQAASRWFVLALGVPGLLGSLGFLLGVVGLHVRQAHRVGVFGWAAFLLAFIGVALSLGANWAYAFVAPYIESVDPALLDTGFSDPGWGVLGTGFTVSYLSGGLAWLFMGVATLTARVLPRWVGVTIVASILASGLAPLDLFGLSGVLVNVFLAAGPIAVGFALLTEAGEPGEPAAS